MKFTMSVYPSFVFILIYIFTFYATPQYKYPPSVGGHEIYNFKRPFLGYYYFIFSLFYVCFGIENNILMQFHLCLKGQCNSMRTPVPEVIKFKILEFPSSIIITTVYVQFVRSTFGRRDGFERK